MSRLTRRLCCAFGFGVLGLYVAAAQARAAESEPYSGIDLVVLIDQSGSMWGLQPDHPARNDSLNHRIGETQFLIEQLATRVRGTAAVHRVSVVDFGDEASVALSGHVMRYNRDDPDAVERETAAVVEAAVTPKELINTNTPEAIRVGIAEFAKMDAAESIPDRLRVMLLITDGRANLPGLRDLMPDRVRTEAAALEPAAVELYVVGINDADNYWNDGDGEFWESVTGPGRALLAENPSTRMASILRGLLSDWLERVAGGEGGEPRTLADCDASVTSYSAPPYVSRLTFNASFGAPRSPLTITAPDGQVVPQTTGASPTGTSARYERRDAPPGTYVYTKDPSRYYCVVPELEGPAIERAAPGPSVDPGVEQNITFQLSRSDGQPLQPLADWPLVASIIVTDPAGKEQTLDATVDAVGRIAARWTPAVPGTNQLRLVGIAKLPDGTDYDVLSESPDYDQSVEVSDRKPIWLHLRAPDPANRSLTVLPWAAGLTVELQPVTGDDEPVDDVGSLVANPSDWVSVQRIDADDLPVADAVTMTLSAANTLLADLPIAFDWGLLWGHSTERLLVTADPSEVEPAYVYSGMKAGPDAAGFVSMNGPQSIIGPIEVTVPRWLRVALWVIPLLVLIGILLAAGVWLAPGVMIWQSDGAKGRSVDLWVYDGLNDPNGYAARKLPVTGWHRFKLDKKLTLKIDGQEYIADRLRVVREPTPGSAMARIEYRWHDDKRLYRAIVKAGSPPKQLQGVQADQWVIALKQS